MPPEPSLKYLIYQYSTLFQLSTYSLQLPLILAPNSIHFFTESTPSLLRHCNGSVDAEMAKDTLRWHFLG